MNDIILYFGGLLTFCFIETFLLILILLKTPAWKFFKAGLRHRMILIHPRETHYIEFVDTNPKSSLAYVKNKGYYLVDPRHVYVEGKSKVPCSIVYGNFALSLNPKMAKIAEWLKSQGLRYYEDLQKLIEGMKELQGTVLIKILGESVDMNDMINYFSSTERSDIIEAEIQRRTASQVMAKLRQPGDLIKFAVVALIIMVGLAITFAIVAQVLGMQTPFSGVVQQASKVIAPIATTTVPTAPTGVS